MQYQDRMGHVSFNLNKMSKHAPDNWETEFNYQRGDWKGGFGLFVLQWFEKNDSITATKAQGPVGAGHVRTIASTLASSKKKTRREV